MVKIRLNYEKYDFLSCGVTIEKYLEYFGYKNPKSTYCATSNRLCENL